MTDPTTAVVLPVTQPWSQVEVDLNSPEKPRDGRSMPSTFGDGPMARLKAERVASGEMHVIERCRFGEGRWTLCVCGVEVTGRSDEEMARAWAGHVTSTKSRSGPVERATS